MAQGISLHGDVLVNLTADGVDLNEIWAEVQEVLELFNQQRTSIANLLSYRTVNVADAIPQSITSDSFEEATEVGIPRAIRPPSDVLKLGYAFRDFDLSLRASWKFLREATAEQVRAQVTRIFEADNKLTNGTVLRRAFDPATQLNEWGHTCYGLWNADGMVPPPYLGNTFDGTHSHYLTSGSDTLDAADVEAMIHHVQEHGYGVPGGPNSATLLLLCNPLDVEDAALTAWRAGVEYASGAPLPKWDFIPSALMPAWISQETIHGPVPNAEFNGLQVWGSYGTALLIQSYYVPRKYVALVATGGPNSQDNPIGFREHVNVAYQGLRHIPGHWNGYPLQDSFFARGFGVGTRHRGAAVVTQITTASSYTPPTTIET
ncbi:hypothetical protein MSP7336_03356 [Mycobacterium shimoidei]|uniref:Bacteriophage protein n=1 Tax=Mycobacterium shimoidei TaxID=29313 RepID=A0A375Z1W9_MYCSH|nr:hypothetical protein [Mycobacterium shimoidei]SRX95092.1 hypothetical protein MSP7336_03356 [Mycobacterium shimoidei]